MPTKQDYKKIIERKLSAESDKNQEKGEDGVYSSGSNRVESRVSTPDK